MHYKNILGGFLLILLFISCKEENTNSLETNELTNTEEVIDKNIFTVTLNITVKKDDSFQIYYKDVEELAFEEENSIFIEFTGSDQPQDIVFKLPEDVLPSFLRLDFGTNKEQSEIVINSFKINYLDKVFESKGNDFFNYFYSNELLEVNKEKAIVKPITSEKGDYDPIFCSGEGLKTQIDLLIK
jgi:hypothetical protein